MKNNNKTLDKEQLKHTKNVERLKLEIYESQKTLHQERKFKNEQTGELRDEVLYYQRKNNR